MTKKTQLQIFDPIDYAIQGPKDRLSDDARAHLVNVKAEPGRVNQSPYYPANSSEGMMFEWVWCDRCVKDDIDEERYCPILTKAAMGDEVAEWTYEAGKPCCSEFQLEKHER